MNADDTKQIYDVIIELYTYVQTYYYYYTGLIVGMLIDDNKFKNSKELIKYIIIGSLLVNVSVFVLIENNAPKWVIITFTALVGLYFHPTLKHILSETLPKSLDLFTDSVLKIGKAIADRAVDIIKKK